MPVKAYPRSSSEWRAHDSILVLADAVEGEEESEGILVVEEDGVGICPEEAVAVVVVEEGGGSVEVAIEHQSTLVWKRAGFGRGRH